MSALTGVKVLDFTRMHSGPFASMILGDLGATVLKVEPPIGDETRRMTRFSYGEMSAFFAASNRNKRSLVVDLHDPANRPALDGLIADADVIIDNFRPSTLRRFRLHYDDVVAINPDVISVSVSGYGEGSPEADSPAYDLLAQARSGLMSLTGEPDGPPLKCGGPVGDLVAGLYAVIGALAALHERAHTGHGQRVEVAMLDAQIAMVHYHYGYFDASGVVLPRVGSEHQNMVPYGIFRCRDGFLAIAAVPEPPKFWHDLCAVLGHPEWRDDPRFATADARHVNRMAFREAMERILGSGTRVEWFEALRSAGVPVAPVNGIDDLDGDEQVRDREMIVTLKHPAYGSVRMPGNPIKMRGALPGDEWIPPPTLGEWTQARWPDEEVTSEAGTDDGDAPGEEGQPFDASLVGRHAGRGGDDGWVLLAWDCERCARVTFGVTGRCPNCGTREGRATTLGSEGVLETWSRIAADDGGYIVGYAVLAAETRPAPGVRVFGRVEAGAEDDLRLGMPVSVQFRTSPVPGSSLVHHCFIPA